MTKKDYKLIAAAMLEVVKQDNMNTPTYVVYRKLVENLSTAFKQDNPLFKPEKFSQACGI